MNKGELSYKIVMQNGRINAYVTPRHIQEVQASKLGDAQGILFFINKNIRSSFKTLYFYCFIYHVLFLECHFLLLSVCFVFFAVVYGWILAYFVLERDTLYFHCLEHSSFHSYYFFVLTFC